MATTSDDELEYLSPGFDPASLTVPRLRHIFVTHDISYPSTAKKSQLVDLFNEKLAPRARRLLAARDKIKRTSAGIVDVPSSQEPSVDGDNDEVPPMRETPATDPGRSRRSRSTRASTDDTLAEPTASKTRGRRKTTKTPATTGNESVANTEAVRPSAHRGRRSAAPEVKAEEDETPRPIVPDDESPFSNENPFQSGSSPLVQTEIRRKSAAKKADRKSTSRRRKTEEPTRIKTEPDEDEPLVATSSTYEVPVKSLNTRTKEEEMEDPLEASEEFTAEEQQALIQEGAARGEVDVLNLRRRKAKNPASSLKTAPVAILAALLATYAALWRKEKIEVGYCGVGKPATTLVELQVPEPLAVVLQPQCEPCPLHAYCYSDFEARCEHDFVLKSHPLSFGGIIPLTPTCEPDGEKARKVKTVADRAVEELRDRRAKFECGELTEEDGKRAKAVEISEPSLKAEVSSKRRHGMTDQEFEDLWKGAIGEITAREEVTSDKDGSTSVVRLSSSSLARISFKCYIQRWIRTTLAKYRVLAGSILVVLALVAYLRNYINSKRSDNARIPGLVSMTLDRVATQAALHAQGSNLEPFVSVGQMRDDVLRDEFSAKRRDQLWKRVQEIVENNANVRSSVKEGRSGEISRVWEWIGSLEAIEDSWMADRRRSGRYSLGPIAGTPNGSTDGRGGTPRPADKADFAAPRKWDEGRPIY